MTDERAVLSLIQSALTKISPEEFPEVCDYLSAFQENGWLQSGDDSLSPYEIANGILVMDKPARFPGCLIDLITRLFEMEIEDGNADAMNDLGTQYYDGNRGFEQSFEKAVRYYKTAAENGSRQAQENLGYCYYYGRDDSWSFDN